MASIRYRADSRLGYAQALLALVWLGRHTTGPHFTFGPLSLDMLEQSGLEVTGEDLSDPTDTLSMVPGLTQVPA